ncbi:hypothetical protein G419_02435 [Rhodococcus triatomae BKS 15-14]|nr:hypothetical protein G419_02435 [Rhodococcus triatomae BKS 15-14]
MIVGVPDTLEEALSPKWLTAALQDRYPGIEVRSVTPGPVVDRVSTNARFGIDWVGGPPEGPSAALCVKGYFNEQGRNVRFIGEREACFYRDLAPESDIRTLPGVYADFDPETRHGVVVTEDIVAQGGSFLDAASRFTPDQVAESLDQFALLHASTWTSPKWAATPWLEPKLAGALRAWGIDEVTSRVERNLHGDNGARVPREVRDAPRLVEVYSNLIGALAADPPSFEWCVIHGDAHVGNLFLDRDGSPCLVDWQLVQRGPWFLDVGTHIATALTVEDRRRAERDLLSHYLDRLAFHGVDAPSFDSAWHDLGHGIVRGMFLWGITVEVDPRLIEILLHRLGTAAADHGALSLTVS